MPLKYPLLLVGTLAWALWGCATGEPEPVVPVLEPIRVLIVDGFSNHDWRKTSRSLETVLERTGRFEVEISTSPESAESPGWESWRPRFQDFAVVIQNANNIHDPEIRWPRAVEEDLERYVASGGGLLIFHSANNAFAHWDEYNRMIGLGWRGSDYGTALELTEAGEVRRIPPGQGDATSHGPRQDTVVRRLSDHPISRGLPDRWLTPDIEVYEFARGPAEAATILSYGRHAGSGRFWPLEWTVDYGDGHVYASSFGHVWKDDEGLPEHVRCTGFQTSLIRATEWLATGEATWPVPEDFPSEHEIRLRPE